MEEKILQISGDLEILTDLAQRMLDQITEAQASLENMRCEKN